MTKIFEQADTLDNLSRVLNDYFVTQGISSLAVTYYNRHTKTGSKLIYDWVSNSLKTWHTYYLQEGYADNDRTLEEVEHSLKPIFWDVQDQLKQAKNAREQRIRLESISYGIDKGLSITVFGPQRDFIVLTLHQRVNEIGLEHWQEKQYEWIGFMQTYFYYLRNLIHVNPVPSLLTRREKECLLLTEEGLRIEIIGQRLKITPRTVNFHLQNANKKLGVSNKYLAISRLSALT